jgi:hypothetical protein
VPSSLDMDWIEPATPVCNAEESVPTTTLVIPKSHRLQQFGDLLSLNSYPNALKTFDFVHSWGAQLRAHTHKVGPPSLVVPSQGLHR